MASVGVEPQAAAQPRLGFLFKDSALRTALFGLLLAVVTIAVYSPVHDHPFASLDDPKYVTQNTHIANGLTGGAVFWAFTHGYAGNYHPLTWVSHALDIQLFGFDPAPHHDENVLLHALDAVLLFWVLKRATGYAGRSLMVAALFALHPVNVESVAWLAERKTMLSTLFCLLALAAYRWYASKPSVGRYLATTGLFILGLWSKPQIIMLPLVLLLWDYWPLQRMFAGDQPASAAAGGIPAKSLWWLVKEKFPLFFICIVDAGVTMIAQHVAGEQQPYTLWIRIENAFVSYTPLHTQSLLADEPCALLSASRQVRALVAGVDVNRGPGSHHRAGGAGPAAQVLHCGMAVVPHYAAPLHRLGAGRCAGYG